MNLAAVATKHYGNMTGRRTCGLGSVQAAGYEKKKTVARGNKWHLKKTTI